MAISFIFSIAIYTRIDTEFNRFERVQTRFEEDIEQRLLPSLPSNITFTRMNPQAIREARIRLLIALGGINLAILIIAGGAAYFLAGRTLKPISEMVDEQNRFITDASHEMRTPLTSLRSEIEVALRDKKITGERAKQILKSNLEEVINLQTLSNYLLELSQKGKPQDIYKTKIFVGEAIEQALKRLNGSIAKKKIKIDKKISNAQIQGISDRIVELFVILIDNAVKYSPTGSTIQILSKRTDGKAIIEIKDNGMGISEEDLPHIFDRFYRAGKSRSKEKIAGYGLGLSIAKDIVEQHNGTINIKSQTNKGTTVLLEF